MKTRTKLLTALLSTVTALSCALTAAAAPAITLQGNEATPADGTNPGTAELKIQATDFTSVAGADLEFTLASGVTLTGVTITNADGSWAPTNGENYTLKGNNTVKIIDVFSLGSTTVNTLDLTVTLNFDAAKIGRYNIVEKAKLVDKDEKDVAGVTIETGSFVIGKNVAKDQATVVVPECAFVPYGGVVVGTGYAEKESNGTFTGVSESNKATVTSFILPEASKKLTTFGASRSTKSGETNVIQFGSYVNSVELGDSYGTVLIGGDFDDIVKYYQEKDSNTYKTAEDVLKRFMELLDSKPVGKFYKITYSNKAKSVKVAKVPQTKYMWRNSEEAMTLLQYAVRLSGVTDENAEYTAVGYSYDNTNYEFSTEIKTATLGGLGN